MIFILKLSTALHFVCIKNKRQSNIGYETIIQSKNSMNILGIIFDSKLSWVEHIKTAIKTSNITLHAIKIIRKYFNLDELKILLTSLFFSKLYYGAEIWHTTGLNREIQKSLKFTSANVLKICRERSDSFMTHTEIHKQAKRALPEQMF